MVKTNFIIHSKPKQILSIFEILLLLKFCQTFSSFFVQTSPDGNVTLSTLNYVPSVRDAGKFMACRAENPEVPDATLEDGWKVEIHCKKTFIFRHIECKNTSFSAYTQSALEILKLHLDMGFHPQCCQAILSFHLKVTLKKQH